MGRLGIPELVIIVLSAVLYFLPSILGRKKNNFNSILILNILLGWTLIGWVVALVWAVSKDKKEIFINNTTVNKSKIEDLAQLRKLLDEGTLTNDEFELEKKRILNN